MSDFVAFRNAVAKQFAFMQQQPQLFRVSSLVENDEEDEEKKLSMEERRAADRDSVWAAYQAAFPSGTNPIYRERAEHDCACCRSFVKAVGNVVAVIDGKVHTIWDIQLPDTSFYSVVARHMAELVRGGQIVDFFLHFEKQVGHKVTFEEVVAENGKKSNKEWDHFHAHIDSRFVMPNAEIATALSEMRGLHDVFERSLDTISIEAVDSVLELISQNLLYRGEENKFAVTEFRKSLKTYDTLSVENGTLFAWSHALKVPGPVAKMRNTAIGTLLVDLAEGEKDFEVAVKSFEDKVSGTNYKRTTALVTPAMIEKAKAELESLGLIGSLQRRFAVLNDISVNNVLFADRTVRTQMDGGDVFDDLIKSAAPKTKSLDRLEEVPIQKFLTDVLPQINSIELLLENHHSSNLVSLIAPQDPTAPPLFKWDNGFSWSYTGEVADAIKERVKQAGGSVVGDVCCRLAWSNFDDLDFHMIEPGGYEIDFRRRGMRSPSGGMLDVDMNAGMGRTREPVENIFYQRLNDMQLGTYTLNVHNYARRETKDVGFEIQIDIGGDVTSISHPQAVPDGKTVTVAKFKVSGNLVNKKIEIIESLPSSMTVKESWGLKSQSFHKVNLVLLSPNHWDDNVSGNKHYFFMLNGCHNDGSARPFFNEFFRPDMDKHRKVLEMLGGKIGLEEVEHQLSGLGFSSTARNYVVAKVSGTFNRMIKIVF